MNAPEQIRAAILIVMDRVFVVVEERMLEEKYGQTWLGYKSRTHRWV